MSDKKPRKMVITTHIEQGDSIEGVWDDKRGVLTLKVLRDGKNVSAQKVQMTTLYERPKKPKFLNQIEFKRSSEFTLEQSALLQRYEQLWAIDTNRKEIFDQLANVCVVTACNTSNPEEFTPILAIIFGETKNNPELYGWRKFIELVQNTEQYDLQKRYGLVVDSEFSNVSKFNDKSIPIHGNFYLPHNWDLIYATSDSGKENIFNKLLSESDKASSDLLKLIAQKKNNAKHWNPILDEEIHHPSFLPLVEHIDSSDE